MTPRKKRLGRGLDALLSKPVLSETMDSGDVLRQIPLDLLQRGEYQPRIDMRQDTLEDLANSIEAQGIVQPIVARRIDSKGGNLNPLEEGRALERLIREFDLTHEEAAKAVGRSRASVSNLLRLQDLSAKVKPLLEDRQLEMGHARALLSITDATQQFDAARQVVRKGLSVRETERLVKRMLEGKPRSSAKKTTNVNRDIRRLEIEVSEKLGAKVRLDHAQSGAGKIVISYNSLDELDGILQHIK